jgi:digeranylgeranylglycerophospholipid reductase
MAAKMAAERGLDVILLEKRQEIGDPVRCAEGVNKYELSQIIRPDPKWIAAEVKGAKIYAPDGTNITFSEDKLGSEVGYVLERKIFDRALAMEAASAGARIMVKTRVQGLIIKNGCARGVSASRFGSRIEINAPLVIGADGVESKVGRWAGIDTTLKPKDIGVCAQFLVQDPSIDDQYCEFFFGNQIAPGGYVWSFPKGDKLANVGIGVQGSRSQGGEPLRLLKQFLKRMMPEARCVEMVAGGVPLSGPINTTTSNGVMLAGDAARQSDPLTGGGILNAMQAGLIAGEVAAKAVSAGDTSKIGLVEYEDRWRELLGMQIARSYECKEFIYKLKDEDLNQLFLSLKSEDLSNMDLQRLGKVLFRLNPRLLWQMRHLIV